MRASRFIFRSVSDQPTHVHETVAALLEKPVGRAIEARWLEPHEAALLLEAARRYPTPKGGIPFAYALIGFFLLTGCRETEVYGVELDDVSFERQMITIRPNRCCQPCLTQFLAQPHAWVGTNRKPRQQAR